MQGAVAGIVIFVIFMALCFMTVPIGISIGAACVIYCLLGGSVDMNYITTNMFTGCDSFPLMAIPFFVLSGALMEGGGLSKRLVNFFDAFVGHKTGGLAIVCVIACMFFGAISGSAPATVAAIGTIMAPSMIERGYSKGFTMALIAASGCLGTIIPPSIPMVMFGVATGTSISSLFMAGFLPGIACGLCLIVLSVMASKKNGWTGNGLTFTWARVGREFKDAIWALLVPVIILGGIYGGIFTPTEAAVVAVVYALIIGLFVYKELDLSTVWVKLFDSAKTTGTILIIVATGTVLGRVLTLDELFEQGYKAIFLATGAGLPKFMGIPGENANGVFSANEYLTRSNLMKAFRDDYDTPIAAGKKVAVVGGGNVAMDAARTARRLGAEVTVVYRRGREEMPARAEEVHHAEQEGIRKLEGVQASDELDTALRAVPEYGLEDYTLANSRYQLVEEDGGEEQVISFDQHF